MTTLTLVRSTPFEPEILRLVPPLEPSGAERLSDPGDDHRRGEESLCIGEAR